MAKQSAKREALTLTATVLAKLAEDEAVRQELPGGGRLRLDYRLPFICVYRRGADVVANEEVELLISSELASLIVPADARAARQALLLLHALVENLATHFGSFLVLEIGSESVDATARPPLDNGRPAAATTYQIVVPQQRVARTTVESLAKGLGKSRGMRGGSGLSIAQRDAPAPCGLKPLLKPAELEEWNSYLLGLTIRVPRHASGSAASLVVSRSTRGHLHTALHHAFFTFAHRKANVRPTHYYALGRRSIVKAVFEIDRKLAAIGRSFDLLLQATPVNAESAWREFRRNRFEKPPVFYYRPLALDPVRLKRQLFAIPVEHVDDPTLSFLFRQKQDELDRQITLLTDVDSSRFLQESLQIYGGVSDWLLAQAAELLDKVPAAAEESPRREVGAAEFARSAVRELAYYRRQCPNFTATANVREDIFAGMMVSADQLLIGGRTRVPRHRVNALLQHEIGTHLVTRFNGRQQPFRQLEVGLAGYDGLQEGLAVLAEYLVGGLNPLRVRILAARVVAARQMLDGAAFIEAFRSLVDTHGFAPRVAYTTVMRIFRGGGLTKDAVYLRGLLQILKYLREGGDLEPLFVGKIAAAHLPLIAELRLRHVVKPPVLRPRYLVQPTAQEKITRLRKGLSILQLLEE